MKEIVILSGKGGTGKTILTASLACLVENKIMADCDVDAPDLHLLLKQEIMEEKDFKGGVEVEINQEKCIKCGDCLELCRFGAVEFLNKEKFIIDDFSCEGCGLCFHACPVEAIKMEIKTSGKTYISKTKYGTFVHAQLGPGEENSGRLSAKVKEIARETAIKENIENIIIDGSPGIGCPVIATLSGANLALIVTEPSLSGISDLKRVSELALFFKIEIKVIINKWDINKENSRQIEQFCGDSGIEMIGKIPFSEEVVEAIQNGIPPVEYLKGEVHNAIVKISERV